MAETLTVSCDDCTGQNTERCDDCLVSFVLGHEPDDALVIDASEARVVRMLAGARLVPRLRHAARTG
jgi:hypothetical protein